MGACLDALPKAIIASCHRVRAAQDFSSSNPSPSIQQSRDFWPCFSSRRWQTDRVDASPSHILPTSLDCGAPKRLKQLRVPRLEIPQHIGYAHRLRLSIRRPAAQRSRRRAVAGLARGLLPRLLRCWIQRVLLVPPHSAQIPQLIRPKSLCLGFHLCLLRLGPCLMLVQTVGRWLRR